MKSIKLFLIVAVSTFCWSGLQAEWKKIFSLSDRHGPASVMAKDGTLFVFDKANRSITRVAEENTVIYTLKRDESFLYMAAVNKNELWLLKNVRRTTDKSGKPLRDEFGSPLIHDDKVVEKWNGSSFEPMGNVIGARRLLLGQDRKMYLLTSGFIRRWQDSSWKIIVKSPVWPIFAFGVNKDGSLWFCCSPARAKKGSGKRSKPQFEFFVWDGKETKSVGFLKKYETNSKQLPEIGLMKMENKTLYKWIGPIAVSSAEEKVE